jgi:penicillin amidase
LTRSVRIALRIAAVLVAIVLIVAVTYTTSVFSGMHAAARTTGTLAGLGVRQPVEILRDARGVPHIRARNERDAFFAQGFVEGSDRLFQLDLLRRYVYGQLAEILGKPGLAADEDSRIVPVRAIAATQWSRLDERGRSDLQAFADGVNAAMRTQPTPVEFRALTYRPQPWAPQDSLAVGFATVLDLTDDWNEVAGRDPSWRAGTYDATNPITDPCYDAPVTEGLAHVRQTSNCTARVATLLDPRAPVGSNQWAAGAGHTTTGRALLANDPHLRLGIPGVWYLVDLSFPGYHAAGATLAGTPGVILGHNDRIAWAATNGTTASLSVYEAPPLDARAWQSETFHVRFGGDVQQRYYRTPDAFGTKLDDGRFVLVRWDAYANPRSSLATFDALDRAGSIEDAVRALRTYPGPTQNFALADVTGRAAYHLAGAIPNDPAWSRYVHPAKDLAHPYPLVAFDELPHVAASRDAVVWTSNNKMYGPGYPLRLSPEFAPPYRAYRVAQMLAARNTYDVAYFTAMQMDTLSLAERDLARAFAAKERNATTLAAGQRALVASLAAWDGRFAPDSHGATIAAALRKAMNAQKNQNMMTTSIYLRSPLGNKIPAALDAVTKTPDDTAALQQTWGVAGAVRVKHPLAALGMSFLNGTTFAGNGDSYTVHVQNGGFSQSFRAVWDVGNWDAGGITIPQGESGQPGSGHYTDQAADWVAGKLLPLPFSYAAVRAATADRLTLTP